MEIEFDPAKDRANRLKHGLSRAAGGQLFDDPEHLIIPSIRLVHGEERFKVIGLIGDRLHAAIFVWRGERARFISVRRSNKGETRTYFG